MPTPEEALKAFWDSADAYAKNVEADNYNLDPELYKNLTTIYGDISKLNLNTINNLKNTWSKNPLFIINTALLKNNTLEKNPISIKLSLFDSPNFAMGDTGLNPLDKSKGPILLFTGKYGVNAALKWLKEHNYGNINIDNMYGANTNAAINAALQDKSIDSNIKSQLTALLELYKGQWVPLKKQTIASNTIPINTLATPVGLKTINYGLGRIFALDEPPYSSILQNPSPTLATLVTQVTNPNISPNLVSNVQTNISKYNFQGDDSYWSLGSMQRAFDKMFGEVVFGNKYNPTINLLQIRNHVDYNREWNKFLSSYKDNGSFSIDTKIGDLFKDRFTRIPSNQQGGNLNNMNQLEILKKAFINYLVQVTGAKTELDLAKLGLDLIKQLYQLFTTGIQDGSIEVSQDGQVNVKGRKAALGAKLSYFNKLQGKCPEGEQLVTFKIGGRVCTACLKGNKVEKKQTTNLNTNLQPKKLDPEKTPVLPGGKYPVYWTADDRIKWERKYGLMNEGAAVSPPPVKKNQFGDLLDYRPTLNFKNIQFPNKLQYAAEQPNEDNQYLDGVIRGVFKDAQNMRVSGVDLLLKKSKSGKYNNLYKDALSRFNTANPLTLDRRQGVFFDNGDRYGYDYSIGNR